MPEPEATTCTVITDASKDIDAAPRCGKPAVKRLPGDLDFPVCQEHADLFSPDNGSPEDRPYRCVICGQETVITRGNADPPLPWPNPAFWLCHRSECHRAAPDNRAPTEGAISPDIGRGSDQGGES